MHTFLQTILVIFDPLRTDGHARALARLCDIDRFTINQIPTVQLNQSDTIFDLFDHTFKSIILADKLCHKAILGAFIKLVGRGNLLNNPIVEHRNPIRHRQSFRLVVGHIDHCDPKLMGQVCDLKLHLFAQLFVEGAQRLIHQNQFRFKDQSACQCDTLLLATRQLGRAARDKIAHLNHIQRALHLSLAIRLSELAHLQRKRQILPDRHMREQGIVLKHHANATFVRWDIVDRLSIKQNFAVSGGLKSSQHHQASGFARTRWAQHG